MRFMAFRGARGRGLAAVVEGGRHHHGMVEGDGSFRTTPALFGRFTVGMIGHGAPMIRPLVSQQLDCEGEVIGRTGRHIAKAAALGHVAGYIACITCNEGSVRDHQFEALQSVA